MVDGSFLQQRNKENEMNKQVLFYLLISLAGIVWGAGDFLLNHWAKAGVTVLWLIGGLLICNLAMGLFVYILARGYSFAFSGVFFGVAYNTAILLICRTILHEDISSLSWAGLVIAFAGVAIASIGR